jgi:hypothetical protein
MTVLKYFFNMLITMGFHFLEKKYMNDEHSNINTTVLLPNLHQTTTNSKLVYSILIQQHSHTLKMSFLTVCTHFDRSVGTSRQTIVLSSAAIHNI